MSTQAAVSGTGEKNTAEYGRRRKRAEGRKNRRLKLTTDREFAKQYFDLKSKRSIEKKAAFRKKKSKKK